MRIFVFICSGSLGGSGSLGTSGSGSMGTSGSLGSSGSGSGSINIIFFILKLLFKYSNFILIL